MMNEKVKLPRNVIDTFRPALDSPHYKRLGSLTPIRIISNIFNHTLKDVTNDVANWLNDYDNQWKLIDAIHYGYEAEREPRWGIKAGNCYMDNTIEWSFETVINPYAIFDEFDYFTNKAEADDLVKTLGFGEVVDLNKETKADEPESEQLYYVQFVKGDYESFLNVSKVGDKVDIMTFDNDDDHSVNGYRTKFTMEEIEAIDSRYKPFAVPVEEVDGNEE